MALGRCRVVDAAMGRLSGTTSQPSLNTLASAAFTARTGLSRAAQGSWHGAHYRRSNRPPGAEREVYRHEMPGGQYTNLYQQAAALGIEGRWGEVCRMYAEVNRLFGDIVKVTPTSKVVGDMALFMVANNLTPDEVLHGKRELAFPESVVEFFEGKLVQPVGGFPRQLQQRVLKLCSRSRSPPRPAPPRGPGRRAGQARPGPQASDRRSLTRDSSHLSARQ